MPDGEWSVDVVLEETPLPPGPVTPDATQRGLATRHDAERVTPEQVETAEVTVTSGISEEHTREPKMWEPGGPSPNPSGRTPDKYTLSGTLKAKLAAPVDPDDPDGPTVAEALADEWIKVGLSGDAKALEALSSRVEGKPAQAVSLSLDGASPLHHQLGVRTSGPRRSASDVERDITTDE